MLANNMVNSQKRWDWSLGSSFEVDPEIAIQLFSAAMTPLSGPRPAGERLVFSIDLPVNWHGSQVLLFARNSSGTLFLISTPESVAGDIRFGNRVNIPRQDASTDGRHPCVEMTFTQPGCFDLLAVIAGKVCDRLDRHPVFKPTISDSLRENRNRPASLPMIGRSTFESLIGMLTQNKLEDWCVAMGGLEIVEAVKRRTIMVRSTEMKA